MNGEKHDEDKLDWTLLPIESIEKVIDVLQFGAIKYGRENWKHVENADRRYIAAAYRHMAEYLKGESSDIESGLPHLAHAAASILFALYFDEIYDEF